MPKITIDINDKMLERVNQCADEKEDIAQVIIDLMWIDVLSYSKRRDKENQLENEAKLT